MLPSNCSDHSQMSFCIQLHTPTALSKSMFKMFIILLKLTKMGASVSSCGTSLSVVGQYVGLQRNLGKLYTSITRPASQLIEWLVQSLTAPGYQVFFLGQIFWKYSVTTCTFSRCNHSVVLVYCIIVCSKNFRSG